jgi:dipeptidyl aminopeptidase/acylaminoacyl peptidase
MMLKSTLSIFLLLTGLACPVFGQSPAKELAGSWRGTLEAGATKLRLLVTVTKSVTGVYSGEFESLDQGAKTPLDTVSLKADDVRFESKYPAFVFDGVLNKEATELAGTFRQSGQAFPLKFKRSETAAPSTTQPKPDYSAPSDAPYTAEDVRVKQPAGFALAGTLTLPKGARLANPVPAIVTITGSGPQDRDESLGIDDFRPFRQIADALGYRGIAVLRMDDRGTGASGGTFKGATSADFAEDIRAGLAYLRTRPEIRADRLGVLGHSEGAVIAPMVADREPTLHAIVLLAGVAQPARSALYFQMKNMIEHDAKTTPQKRAEAIAAIDTNIEAMMAKDPWLKFFLTYDPATTMRRVKTPVLILTGEHDQQAEPTQVPLMEAAFKEAGNPDVTARILPGINHIFVEDSDGFPANYAKLPKPIRMQQHALDTISDWLAQRMK